MVSPRKARSFYWSSRLLAGAIVLFPLALNTADFRSVFSQGLSVSANKTSPAYAAFEALRENFDAPELKIPDKGERLAAGQTFDSKQLHHISTQRLLSMKGMTIRQPAIEQAKPVMVAHLKDYTDPDGELLSVSDRKQMLLADVKKEDWSIPNPGDYALQLATKATEAAISAAAVNPNERIITSRTGTPIIIRRSGEPPPSQDATGADEKVSEEERFVSSLATRYINPADNRPLWLHGQLEMTGGLAFVGPETHIVIKRMLDGRTYEKGRIWVSEGRFEIHVKNPVGYLVAELQTRDGRVLGRGEMNLVLLNDIPAKDNKINDIRLSLRPTSEGVAFRTISGYSHDHQRMPIREARVEIENYMEPAKVNDEGVVTDDSLSKSSSFVARATASQHWASVVVGQANHPQDIRLFSNSLIEALIGLELEGMDKKEAQYGSIVWGQLVKNGSPLEGAQVEMAGSYEPIYFNEMYLPDKKQTRTSKNGLFAFLKVKPGVQALRVKANGRMYPAQVFPTEEKHVSYAELEVRDKVVSQFKVMDILDLNKPMSARVRLVGADEIVNIDGEAMVEYALATDPFMVEAEAGVEYEVSRITLTGTPQMIHVPLIRRDWLTQTYETLKIQTVPGRGIVAGFIDDGDYEVEMTGYGRGENMQIAYFDSKGQILQSQVGTEGGGFVIFNAPPGLQTVYIHPKNSRETFSEIVVAEPRYIHVVVH
jgi:hypothetical protein